MTNEISIVDNKRAGILKVKYEGDTFAIFNYCHPIGHSSFRKLGQRNCPVDGEHY